MNRCTNLMSLPTEILCMIAQWSVTPFDESTPLDQYNNSGVKALSLVNKKFRAICLIFLCRVRMWTDEDNLFDHIQSILTEGRGPEGILNQLTSLSIRGIGPKRNLMIGRRMDTQLRAKLFINLGHLLSGLPKLTDLRLVADNGRHGLEPALRSFFNPATRSYPTVKSLYVRTASQMSKIFLCFPNLEAVNFNIHGDTGKGMPAKLSQEIKVLTEKFLRLRSLSIFKTTVQGWTVADIKAIVRQFPGIERLFLEGCLGVDVAHMNVNSHDIATLFAPLRNLRHLALTDELFCPITKNYTRAAKLTPPDPTDRWHRMAAPLFATIPGLQELCIGRQVDFKALVFRRPLPANPAQAEQAASEAAAAGLRVIRSYRDKPDKIRFNYPPATWNGDKRIWWPSFGPVPGKENMGTPDEEPDVVRFLEVTDDVPPVKSLKYQEILLDLCEVSFWDAEWLRVVR